MDELAEKTLVMVVGPSSIGKSTIMKQATEIDDDFSYCRSFTTRVRRSGEQTSYRHITQEEAGRANAEGAALTYVEHPTTGVVYGTDASSYRTRYNLLDTLASTVATYRTLPFKRTVTISLTAEPEDLEQWLFRRYPNGGQEFKKRVEEAVESIAWSLDQTANHHWLINVPGKSGDVARKLISIAHGRHHGDGSEPVARRTYEYLRNLL